MNEQVACRTMLKYSHKTLIMYLGVYSDKDKFKLFSKEKYPLIMHYEWPKRYQRDNLVLIGRLSQAKTDEILLLLSSSLSSLS